jgi:hypothetical protein
MIAVNSQASIDWINKVLTKKLSSLIESVDANTTPDLKMYKVFEQFSTLLTRVKKPYERILYKHLDANNWPKWVETLTSNDIKLPNVLPGKNAITNIGELHLAGTTIDQNILDVLLYTNEIYPQSKEWTSIVNKMNAWLIHPRREANNDSAYQLALALYSSNEENRSGIKASIENSNFLSTVNSDVQDEVPHLPLLIATVLENQLQENATVPAFIKEFWADDKANKETSDFSLDILQKYNLLKTIWNTAKDKKNKFSLMVIERNIENVDLYSCVEGILNLGETYGNFDESAVGNIVKKLVSLSGFTDAQQTLKTNPIDYDETLFALQKYGDYKAIKFVDSVLNTLSIEDWEKSFKSNNWLLNCTFNNEIKLDHKFTKAFVNCVTSLINGSSYFESEENPKWFWKNFKYFVEKTIDTDIYINQISEIYFEVEKDNLNDIAFEGFSQVLILTPTINPSSIVSKVCDWVDAGQKNKLSWFANSVRDFKSEPIQGLISRMHQLQTDETKLLSNEEIDKLIKIFKIPPITLETDEPKS